RSVWSALVTVIGQGFGPTLHEDRSLDWLDFLTAGAEALLEHAPLDAAVDDADAHALAGRPQIVQQALGPHQSEDLVEDVGRSRRGGIAHGPVSSARPSSSSSSRRLSTARVQ